MLARLDEVPRLDVDELDRAAKLFACLVEYVGHGSAHRGDAELRRGEEDDEGLARLDGARDGNVVQLVRLAARRELGEGRDVVDGGVVGPRHEVADPGRSGLRQYAERGRLDIERAARLRGYVERRLPQSFLGKLHRIDDVHAGVVEVQVDLAVRVLVRRCAGDAPPDGGRFGKQDRFGLGK